MNAAAAGDTVVVGAGTYTENLTIDKAITLLGAQAGEAASGTARDGGESVINGGGNFAVTINADGVTIDGFEITGFGRDGINIRTAEVEKPDDPSIGAYRADVEIANNWIHATGTTGQRNGVVIGEFAGGPATSGKAAEIENVSITGNHIEIASNTVNNSRGIVVTNQFTAAPDGFLTVTGLDVSGNTVVSTGNALFASAGIATFRIDGASIADNAFTGTVNSYNLFESTVSDNTFNSIVILGVDGSTVSGNTFNVNNAYGLGLWGTEFGDNVSQDSAIEGNTFNYNTAAISATSTGGVALRAGVEFGTITFSDNTFNKGVFATIPAEDVILRGTSGNDTLDIEGFLTSSGLPSITTIRVEAGAGNDEILLDLSDNVVVLGGDGTDTAVFEAGTDLADIAALVDQFDSVEVIRVGAAGPGATWFVAEGMSIQAAVNAAVAGDTIIVADGFYANVVINKAITLQGANEHGATISGPGGAQGSAIRIEAGVNNVTITEFKIEASAGDLAAIYAVGNNDSITITRNIIDGGTAGHAFLSGGDGGYGLNDSTISFNTLLGNGTTGGTSALVYINGAASLGVSASDNTITYNTIEGEPAGGLLMGIESSDTTITYNTFVGTATYTQLEVFAAGNTIEENKFNATGLPFIGSTHADDIFSANDIDGPVVYIEGKSGFYATIQAAVDAAEPEDILIVGDGDYANVVIDKAITLQAANPGYVTISGPDANQGSAIRIEAGVDDVTISGFNIEASAGDLAAIYAVGDNTNITIEDNTIDGGTAGHAFLSGGANSNGLNNSTISGNTLLGNGGTGGTSAIVYINGAASLNVSAAGNQITDNTIQGNPTGGLLMGIESEYTRIIGNTFAGTASYAQLELFGGAGTIEDNDFGATGLFFVDGGSYYDAAEILANNTYEGPVVYISDKSGFYATIQAAVDAAGVDDTIKIGDGTYNGDVVINGKVGLTLEAINGAAAPTITGSVTVSNTTMAATSLIALDLLTSSTISAATVTLTGTAAEVALAFAATGITGLGNAGVTLSGTTVAAAALNALDLQTSGIIDAATFTTLIGAAADVATAYAATAGITGLGNAAVTLSSTTAAAADLNAIDGKTFGVIAAAALTTLTGTAADVAAIYASDGITGLGNEAVTLSDTTAAAAALNAIDLRTSGLIAASAVTTLTGTVAEVAAAYASTGITGLGNEAVTLSDTTAAAAALNAIDLRTSGLITAATVTTVTGTAADVATAYASAGITGLGNEAVTLSDTTAAAAALNAIDLRTSGLIVAATVTTLTGTAAEVATAFSSAGIIGLHNAAVDVVGAFGNDTIIGTIWADTINGGLGADVLTGGAGEDTFVFIAGQGNGDRIVDFSGFNGDGDKLQFQGYGEYATFSNLTGGLYEISKVDRSVIDFVIIEGDVITGDWTFI